MNIVVNNLEMVDIKDKSRTWNESLGMNVSMQNSFDTPTSIRLGDPSKGTTNVSVSNGGQLVEQTTKATQGKGNYTVRKTVTVNGKTTDVSETNGRGEPTLDSTGQTAGLLSPETLAGMGINSDFTKTQEITTDKTIGGIGASFTAEVNSVLHPVEYVKESLDALTGLPQNLGLAGKRIGNAVNDLGDSVATGISSGNPLEIMSNYKENTNRRVASNNQKTEDLDKLVNKDKYTKKEVKEAGDKYVDSLDTESGINTEGEVKFTDSEKQEKEVAGNGKQINGAGFYDLDKKDIYYNVNENNPESISEVISHEAQHDLDNKTGKLGSISDAEAERRAEHAETHGSQAIRDELALREDLPKINITSNDTFRNSNPELVNQGIADANKVENAQADIVVGHGGAGGNAAGVTGIAKEARAFAGDYPYTYVLDFKHNGSFQTQSGDCVQILKEYKHEDQENKTMWLHSKAADAGTIAFGTDPKAKDAPEHVDELNIVLPRVDLIPQNLKNMSKNADRVNIYVLSEDKLLSNIGGFSIPYASSYGDRSYETLQKELRNQKIPDNVKIEKIENLKGTANHPGVFAEGTVQNFQLWTQYLDSKGITGQNQAPYMFPYVKNTEVEFKTVGTKK